MTSTERVPPEINDGARLLIVGEAPGKEEAEKGRPFVGKSGQLVDNMLRVCGMARSMFCLANVCNYRPPGNNISKATAEQMAEGLADLKALIVQIKPIGIITFGNVPTEALLGFREITSRRGSIYQYTADDGRTIPVIPMLHPAAVLRNSKDVVLFNKDMERFKALVQGKLPANLERRVVINPTEEELDGLLGELREGAVVACDIEADGRELACVGFAPRPDFAVCVPATTPSYRAFIREALSRNCRWVFHNSPYDVAFLAHRCGFRVGGRIEDTLAMHQALHPELPRDLATLTSLYTLQPYYKDMYSEWAKGRDYDTYYTYNGLDCCVTREIWGVLDKQLDAENLRSVYEGTVGVLPHAIAMACLGLRYDKDRAKELRVEIAKEIEVAQAELDELVGKPINVYSPPQVHEFLHKQLRLPVRLNKESGQPTWNEKVLMGLYAKIPDAEIRRRLELLLKIRHLRKFVSSYLNVKLSKDGRCRTSYNPAGTETGRWSASKFLITEGANLQTIPKQWKQCFHADDGMLLWMADYSQIEARFVAWLAEDLEQIDFFRSGGDIHRLNAGRIYRKAPEEIVDNERQVAKQCVHALNYGVGPHTLMETINKKALETGFWLSLDLAKRVRSVYLEQFEDVVRWQKDTWRRMKRDRCLTNPFGRRRIFTGSMKEVGESEHTMKEGIAFVPQSTVPDMMNMAIRTLRENPPCEGFETVMQVHDALGGWGPIDKVDLWKPAIIKAMDIPVPFPIGECRVPIELKIGPRLSELAKVAL